MPISDETNPKNLIFIIGEQTVELRLKDQMIDDMTTSQLEMQARITELEQRLEAHHNNGEVAITDEPQMMEDQPAKGE